MKKVITTIVWIISGIAGLFVIFLVALMFVFPMRSSKQRQPPLSDREIVYFENLQNKYDLQSCDLEIANNIKDSLYDSITVCSLEFTQLDTIATSWRMTKEDIHSFFRGAKNILHSEAAEIISKEYYPFSVTGEIMFGTQKYNYVINPAGVAILFPSSTSEKSQDLFWVNDKFKPTFRYDSVNALGVKVITYRKTSYNYDDNLGEWCRTWWLSSTQIDEYFKLCREWDESKEGAITTLFDNYNCEIKGSLVWNGAIYTYRLWCNGPFLLTPVKLDGHLERLSFVCMDKSGIKYIYEIVDNPTLDW